MGRGQYKRTALRRTWGLLVSLVVCLFLLELRYMWFQSRHDDDNAANPALLSEHLQEGFSYSNDNRRYVRGPPSSVLAQAAAAAAAATASSSDRDSNLFDLDPNVHDLDPQPAVDHPDLVYLDPVVDDRDANRVKQDRDNLGGGGGGGGAEDDRDGIGNAVHRRQPPEEEAGSKGREPQKGRKSGELTGPREVLKDLTGKAGKAAGGQAAAGVVVDSGLPGKRVPEGEDDVEGLVIGEKHLEFIRSLDVKPHNRWIVLDVTSGTCALNLTAPAGWRIVVAGNSGPQPGCRSPVCVDLYTAAQQKKTVPQGLKRTLAYLAAIWHGATQILDADCSLSFGHAVNILKVSSKGLDHGLMYNATLFFNAYTHFGAWSMGRGNSRFYQLRDFGSSVLVKHGLIPRPTGQTSAAGTRFDPSNPPVFVGHRTFSPALPSSSLYRREAFWALLLLPCPAPDTRRCQRLRLLVMQRLFRDVDAFSGLYRLTGVAEKKLLPPVNEDKKEENKLWQLVHFLDAWSCDETLDLLNCYDALADALLTRGDVTRRHHALMTSWTWAVKRSLEAGGAAAGGAGGPATAIAPPRVASPRTGVSKVNEVQVVLGSVKTLLESGGPSTQRDLQRNLTDVARSACNFQGAGDRGGGGPSDWFPVARWAKPVLEDVALVIVFNSNKFFFQVLPFLETMHRPYFKHIVYCVSNVDELMAANNSEEIRHVTLVEGLSDNWYLMYECLASAARLEIQGVKGYLQIGDDTLLNTWHLRNASWTSMWMPNGFTAVSGTAVAHPWGWYWWPKSRGRLAVLKAMAQLEVISGLTPDQILNLDPTFKKSRSRSKHPAQTFTTMLEQGRKEKGGFPLRGFPGLPGSNEWPVPTREDARRFLKNYYTNRVAGLVWHRAMDLFYIPQGLAADYVLFARFFMKHGVMIELAVPTVHLGLASRAVSKYVKANSLWTQDDRKSASVFFDSDKLFLHPFKMKANLELKESRQFYCDVYMKTLFSELGKK